MNIAILIPSLGGGGAERASQILGNYYVEQGNNVYYFLADTKEEQDYSVKGQIIHTNIDLNWGDSGIISRKTFEIIISSLIMRKLKKRYEINIAISFMEACNYINIMSKGREKVIISVRGVLSVYEKQYAQSWMFKRKNISFFYSKSDKLVVLSRHAFKEMHSHYKVPAKKMAIIPNMVLKSASGNLEGENWIYGNKTVICVGRLHPEKQHERIIRAFSYVCSKEPDARLLILGKGQQLRYLQGICGKYKIEDKVLFMGFTDNVSYYLEHARVFVMASQVDCFPNSMLEAMNYGVPVITTDAPGGCGEIIGKMDKCINTRAMTFCKYGILTPNMPCGKMKADSPLSEQEIILGEAVLKVLSEDKIYEEYKKQSLRRAEMYSIDRIIGRWNHILNFK